MQFAVVAADLALRDAGVTPADVDATRAGVVLGTGGVGLHDLDHWMTLMAVLGDVQAAGGEESFFTAAARHLNPLEPLKMLPNMAASHIAIQHGLRGENLTVCTACTSGTQAIGEALRVLRAGGADLLLAGGTDAMVNVMGLVGFGLLGVLSKRSDDPSRASRPFDLNRDGFVMGEGAALLVLETLEHAERRGAAILAELCGYGATSDAWRITDEREDGSGCADAIRRALDDARMAPGDIHYINAHGTGTRMNDRTEARAIQEVFEAHAGKLLVSSTKSQIGHLVAAAGAVEAAACVLALRHQTAPPTINYETPDPECDLDVVANTARPARLEAVLSSSFGFGGQNACIVLGRGEAA
jgi:3-oxoacyl-[acyl-carrier-protein] synthase II